MPPFSGLLSAVPNQLPPPRRVPPPRPIEADPARVARIRQSDAVGSFFRILLVMGVMAGLMAVGWNKSFRQYAADMSGQNLPTVPWDTAMLPPPIQAVPVTVTVPGDKPLPTNQASDWLWDPNRKTRLDEKPASHH